MLFVVTKSTPDTVADVGDGGSSPLEQMQEEHYFQFYGR